VRPKEPRSSPLSFLLLFTRVRGRGFSAKSNFHFTAFSEVGQVFIANSSPGASVVAAAKERRHKKCRMAGIPDRGTH
jgi:hypothetical protein